MTPTDEQARGFYHDEGCPSPRSKPRWADSGCTCKSNRSRTLPGLAAAMAEQWSAPEAQDGKP